MTNPQRPPGWNPRHVQKVSDAEFIEAAKVGPGDPRMPVTMELKVGEFDFRIVAVHLKSSKSHVATRSLQCEAIADFVAEKIAQTDSEKDVLVVGDYNMIPRPRGDRDDSDNFRKLNKHGQFNFISKEYMYLRGSHSQSGGYGNILDGFAISAGRTEEYLDGSLRIFPLQKTMRLNLRDFSEDVADHLPLVARFDIIAEDDD